MRRRALVTGIAGSTLFWGFSAWGEKAAPKIGFLNSASPEAYGPLLAGFSAVLHEAAEHVSSLLFSGYLGGGAVITVHCCLIAETTCPTTLIKYVHSTTVLGTHGGNHHWPT